MLAKNKLATLAGVDVPQNSAAVLRVEQRLPASPSDTEATRSDPYLAKIERVVTTQHWQTLTDLGVDGSCSKKQVVDGLCAVDVQCSRKRRPSPPPLPRTRWQRPGRPNIYAGHGDCRALSCCEPGASGEGGIALDPPGVQPSPRWRTLRLVSVRHRSTEHSALLWSTAGALAAQTLSGYAKARCQLACPLRAANPYAGLRACQVRSANTLRLPSNASRRAGSCATLAARRRTDNLDVPCALARLKQHWFKQHLVERL